MSGSNGQLSRTRHDLRSPINAIIGYSEMWLDDDGLAGDARRRHLEAIRASGRQLLTLVNDIMGSAKGDEETSLREYGVVLCHALRMPVYAILGCVEALREGSDGGDVPPEFLPDLQRICDAACLLRDLAKALSQSGMLPENSADVQSADSSTDATRSTAAAVARYVPPTIDGGRILIVDDNATNLDLLARRLEHLGFVVTVASGGVKALNLLETESFDLVLLDVVMPTISGLQVLQCIRSAYSMVALPVIMVTAMDESDDIVAALGHGANDYVTKPFALPVVTARVRTQLMLKRIMAELEQANMKLESQAFLDGLTGIANRRQFDDTLQREWRRGLRLGECISLIMFDVDYFKQYNDSQGHEAGDSALRAIAQTIAKALERGSDLVARYGGEEFAAILPATDLAGAQFLAEKIRVAVEALNIPHPTTPLGRLTISAGVACLLPTRELSPSDLLSQADAMLYRAKGLGRNRVAGHLST